MQLKIIEKFKTPTELNKIVKLSKELLNNNNISIPKQILFYNSIEKFIDKILPEVKTYGFNEETCREIIKIALNNGTYGTINFKENEIIEMNFNPFNNGEYKTSEFLELIIHEALHLHLSKTIQKDINLLKFKFKELNLLTNPKILQLDEGYTSFMTSKILKNVDISSIKEIRIPVANIKKPKYNQNMSEIDLKEFDRNYEKLFIENKEIGEKIIKNKFNYNSNNEEILNYVVEKLRELL